MSTFVELPLIEAGCSTTPVVVIKAPAGTPLVVGESYLDKWGQQWMITRVNNQEVTLTFVCRWEAKTEEPGRWAD